MFPTNFFSPFTPAILRPSSLTPDMKRKGKKKKLDSNGKHCVAVFSIALMRACPALSGTVSPHVLIFISLHKSVVVTAQLWPTLRPLVWIENPHWCVLICSCVGVSGCGEYGCSWIFSLEILPFTTFHLSVSFLLSFYLLYWWSTDIGNSHLAFLYRKSFLFYFTFFCLCVSQTSVAALTWRHTSWLLV